MKAAGLAPAPLEPEFLSWLGETRGMAPSTVETYRGAMRDFCRRLGVTDYSACTVRDLDKYISLLSIDGLRLETRRTRAHALKSLFRYLHSRGFIPNNPALELKAEPRHASEMMSVFTPAEIEALIFKYSEPTLEQQPGEPHHYFQWRVRRRQYTFPRDAACLAVAYTCGLRVSEPAGLQLRDYVVTKKGPSLIVRDFKWSEKPVVFPIDRRVQALIDVYLVARSVFGVTSPALFPASSGPGISSGRGIGADMLQRILQRRIEIAGINPKGRALSFHVYRYTVATDLRDEGRGLPPEELRVYMRHRDFATTLRYIHLGALASIQRRAIRLLPWNRRRNSWQ